MKFPLVFTTLLASVSLGAPSAALAQTQPAPALTPYPKTFVAGFVQSCKAGAKKETPGIPDKVVDNYCQCLIGQIQQQLPVAYFIDLNNALASKQTLDERQTQSNNLLNQSVQYCVSQQRPSNR